MTWPLLSFLLLAAGFLVLLGLALRRPGKRHLRRGGLSADLDLEQHHFTYFPQVRQSLSTADLRFLATRGSPMLARRARRDRRRVTLDYVKALHGDFHSLLRLARVLAALSPEVTAQQESERFGLAARFECRYRLTRMVLLLGGSPLSQLGRMTQMVGTLGTRLEAAMSRLGEQAALATEFGSAMERGGWHRP